MKTSARRFSTFIIKQLDTSALHFLQGVPDVKSQRNADNRPCVTLTFSDSYLVFQGFGLLLQCL